MDPALRLQPGQQRLTPAQEAERERFADERIQTQLSTEPVNEPEAEAFLRQAYQVAKLEPPKRIHWLDGPLQLVAALVLPGVGTGVGERVQASVGGCVVRGVWASVGDSITDSLSAIGASVQDSVVDSVWDRVGASLMASVRASVDAGALLSAGASIDRSIRDSLGASVWASVEEGIGASVRAYAEASYLAGSHFLDVYLAPNDLQALAHFNELVSGYWLGQDVAVVVRRPNVLARDSEGRLHSATGKCIEYYDGWGFYAWHGVKVPEHVIRQSERLTREDVLNERDVEVRRVIQERMGSRFVPELDGVVLDSSPHGTLYEVRLPEDDPEGVARYVQVQDASTKRRYFVRVPPTIQTAAEAVAWSFNLSAEEYHPAQET